LVGKLKERVHLWDLGRNRMGSECLEFVNAAVKWELLERLNISSYWRKTLHHVVAGWIGKKHEVRTIEASVVPKIHYFRHHEDPQNRICVTSCFPQYRYTIPQSTAHPTWHFCNSSELRVYIIKPWEGPPLYSRWIIQSVPQAAFITPLAFGAVLRLWAKATETHSKLSRVSEPCLTSSNESHWRNYMSFPIKSALFDISTGLLN